MRQDGLAPLIYLWRLGPFRSLMVAMDVRKINGHIKTESLFLQPKRFFSGRPEVKHPIKETQLIMIAVSSAKMAGGLTLLLVAATLGVAAADENVCTSDTNTFTVKVNLYAGEMGTLRQIL